MGDYYNRSRTPLSLTLAAGRSVTVAPKSWIRLGRSEEGLADVQSKVASGDLVPSSLNSRQATGSTPTETTNFAQSGRLPPDQE